MTNLENTSKGEAVALKSIAVTNILSDNKYTVVLDVIEEDGVEREIVIYGLLRSTLSALQQYLTEQLQAGHDFTKEKVELPLDKWKVRERTSRSNISYGLYYEMDAAQQLAALGQRMYSDSQADYQKRATPRFGKRNGNGLY